MDPLQLVFVGIDSQARGAGKRKGGLGQDHNRKRGEPLHPCITRTGGKRIRCFCCCCCCCCWRSGELLLLLLLPLLPLLPLLLLLCSMTSLNSNVSGCRKPRRLCDFSSALAVPCSFLRYQLFAGPHRPSFNTSCSLAPHGGCAHEVEAVSTCTVVITLKTIATPILPTWGPAMDALPWAEEAAAPL